MKDALLVLSEELADAVVCPRYDRPTFEHERGRCPAESFCEINYAAGDAPCDEIILGWAWATVDEVRNG